MRFWHKSVAMINLTLKLPGVLGRDPHPPLAELRPPRGHQR